MTVLTLPSGDAPAGTLRTDRWQPTRAGVLNVWRYYDEVFTFHRGRLLLRGPNGTGKSKALELLLPYLLDANLRPSRLSTFGGSERTMHWNLMGDGYPHTTRVGYVWLEFGHDGDDGPRWFTCGARLAASTNTRTVDTAYFTTELRVGEPAGLSLVKDGNVPLTRQDLTQALGDRGAVHTGAESYRRAVRETLFRGLSETQYEALIATLLQLRTPKLSEHLNPDALSEVLSKALPPLDAADLAEIAEGFEQLDRRRERLARLDEEVTAARRLAERQQRYARRALRRGAAEVVAATTKLDNVTRDARQRRQEHAAAAAELAQVSTAISDNEREQAVTEETIGGLRDSDAYREGQQLDQLRREAATARRTADQAVVAAASRRAEAARASQRAEGLVAELATTAAQTNRSWRDTTAAALAAGMAAHVEPLAAETADRARHLLRGIIRAREDEIAAVAAALATHERAVVERDRAQARRERRSTERDAAGAALRQVKRTYDDEVAELRDVIARWASGCAVLPVTDRAAELADLAGDEVALNALVGDLSAAVREQLAAAHAERRARDAELVRRREPLAGRLAALSRAATHEPVAPRQRTAPRGDRPGAPLWRLVDWRADVPTEVQAAVEAALEASGLLDAWIWPDGSVTSDRRGHDTYLAAATALPAPHESLLAVLAPDERAPVPAPLVAAALAGVAFGPNAPHHVAAVGADGSWRLGPLHGSSGKPDVEFLGAAAQERARQREMTELTAELGDIDAERATVAEASRQLAEQRSTLQAELAARPDHRPLVRAADQIVQAELKLAGAQDLLDEATREAAGADEVVRAALRELTLVGSRHGLPTAAADLGRLTDALRTLRQAAEGWLTDRGREEHTATRLDDARETADHAIELAEEEAARAQAAEETAAGLAARLDAVERTVGVEYRAVLDEVHRLRTHAEELKQHLRRLRPRHEALIGQLHELNARAERAEQDRDDATGVRDDAVARLARLVDLLGADAALATDLSGVGAVTATLQAARQLAEEIGALPHGPRHLRQDEGELGNVLHLISASLAGYADLAMIPDEQCDVQIVTATVDGLRTTPTALVHRLTTERDEMRAHLTEEERQLFDRTLTGDTRRHVAQRIRQAADLVREVSAQLERVRTVSGLGVRLIWEVNSDLDARLRQARDLLLQDPARLTETQRAALHDFFRARIDDIRNAGSTQGWEQQLGEALDYRRWHRFVVQIRSATGDWSPVTRRQHGAKSGGEKAIVLHLPLFAAAGAHYRAAPSAPRLILLDEVFVGVDQTNRGQLMAVLKALDLDLLLTSDQEWCTYAEVDGIAIHQLIAGGEDGDDAVTTARFVWTGHDVVADDEP
ncbi:TIGR02680 family protein [Micromonospora echinaurantiaca]|uniref:TIGR02680 family protein n=1 Tax=Micromonospora echinaurantiaca TaxID=47857 RepID=A0A1C5I666_9ACTN|nr:TIGR02680 family protein [Micromonospora echinaurantiaca]SCG53667.1 TIGR02680 family protein [Micromonospora echinaurantiaca]